MLHRVAFPLVAREGEYAIKFGSENTEGGSGKPKRPHVHVYKDNKIVASFWLWPEIEEKEHRHSATPAEIAKAQRLAAKYLDDALAKWRKHFKDDSPDFTGGTKKTAEVSFSCTKQPVVVSIVPNEFLIVEYCDKAVVLRFENIPEFATASEEQLRNVQAPDPGWPWLHWPDLDADIYLEDLYR
jgi:hypothetical protein